MDFRQGQSENFPHCIEVTIPMTDRTLQEINQYAASDVKLEIKASKVSIRESKDNPRTLRCIA